MKVNFIGAMRAKGGKYKLLANLVCVLIVIAICAGAWFGWQQYQYMQSGQYAFEKLQKSLQPPAPGDLASMVDFNALSQDLADASKKSFPFFMAGPDQDRKLKNLFQTAVLKRFLTKEEPSKANADLSEEEMLKKPIAILPPDFVTQLAANMKYQERDPNHGMLSSKIHNPLLGKDFTLVLDMDKGSHGWRVRHVANADKLFAQLREALLERYSKYRGLYVSKNENTRKRMNGQLPILSCQAHIGMLSDNKTLLMVTRVLARNQGPQKVNNFNVDVEFIGRNGKVVLRRYLNTAKPVAPGEDFDHSWTFDLDPASQTGRALMAAAPLTCRANWQTLGLNSAEVLHIVDLPYEDLLCDIPTHNHPAGFCQLPIFKQ